MLNFMVARLLFISRLLVPSTCKLCMLFVNLMGKYIKHIYKTRKGNLYACTQRVRQKQVPGIEESWYQDYFMDLIEIPIKSRKTKTFFL